MKKKIVFLILIACTLTVLWFRKTVKRKCIAILSTASHPTLDLITNTIQHTITTQKDFPFSLTYFNGQGNILNLNILANNILNDKNIVGIIAIGSPSLVSLTTYGKKIKTTLPIWYCAVSYPEQCNIDQYQGKIYGFSDKVTIDTLIKKINEISEGKKIGYLYCYQDQGSVTLLNQLQNNTLIVKGGIGQEMDLAEACTMLCQQCDIIIIPTDNMIASGIEIVFSIAKKYGIKLFMLDKVLYDKGGHYWYGIDYQNQANQLSHKIISDVMKLV